MNAAVKFQETKSITSLEIAELVEKRHDNVKRTIESLVNTGVIVQPQIEDGIKSANGVIPKI
jgi:phage regulator Rha-like protein